MKINEYSLAFVTLMFWVFLWCVYMYVIETKYYRPLHTKIVLCPKILSLASNLKESDSDDLYIDGWVIVHIVIYLHLALVFPHHWIEVLVISILFEVFEYYINFRAKWILDPLTNLIGYLLGHIILKIYF